LNLEEKRAYNQLVLTSYLFLQGFKKYSFKNEFTGAIKMLSFTLNGFSLQ